ncbi:MAG: hypothetical protein WB495_03305 [Xanthobacteraceae bacterium]
MANEPKLAGEIEEAVKASTGAKLDQLLEHLSTVTDGMASLGQRIEALEARHRAGDDADGDESEEDENKMVEPGKARPVAADHADTVRRHEARMADAQAMADAVAAEFGERAPPPLSGETLHGYKCRLLRRYKHHSKEFADADLGAIKDPKLFAGIESRIYADARSAGATPDVPAEQLWERVKTDASGRRISEFYGSPRVWMRTFSGHRRYVKSFKS